MVQEASLDTLALAGAMVASLFAGLTFAFARRRISENKTADGGTVTA